MVVLRRSQVVVAGVAAGLLIVLAFLLGLTTGGDGAAESGAIAPRVYTIKLIEFPDTRTGEINAKTLMADLERTFDEEITLQHLDRDRTLFIALGSWLKNPKTNREAVELLKKAKKVPGVGRDKPPFQDAYFFSFKR